MAFSFMISTSPSTIRTKIYQCNAPSVTHLGCVRTDPLTTTRRRHRPDPATCVVSRLRLRWRGTIR